MKRLYYLTDTIDSTESISKDLHHLGITDWNLHVLSKDDDGLFRHHIHGANTLQRLDLIHSGEQGALIGVMIGLCIGVALMLGKPFGIALDLIAISAIVAVFTLFGTWVGGLSGLSHESYKIKRFHDDLDAGKHLIMVDFRKAREPDVVQLMENQHPEAQFAGKDTTWINPFKFAHEKVSH
ncbi:hypothetical protein [Pontibacterium sp.]|uniref:hypothetical protein n=1 Tax=Pontibacterium sp. TaxID=2036026 RepID=UPI0035637D47